MTHEKKVEELKATIRKMIVECPEDKDTFCEALGDCEDCSTSRIVTWHQEKVRGILERVRKELFDSPDCANQEQFNDGLRTAIKIISEM